MKEILADNLLMLTLTVAVFYLSRLLYNRWRTALLHPVLVTFAVMILFLKVTGISYAAYREATSVLDLLLGMSVVSLGYLLHRHAELLFERLVPIFFGTLTGCVAGILSVVYLAGALGADRVLQLSLAPKSTTVPVAVAVVEPLGGVVSVTSVVVFCTGLLGSVAGPWILRRVGVHDRLAQGFALGAASHGIGTARAVEMGAVEGALSGLAMALTGLAMAVCLPVIERWCF